VLAVWWAGNFAAINEARQLAVIGFVQIAIWSMLGSALYRRLLFPCLYLFFLVPAGDYLIRPLQQLTTVMADFGLTALRIPHFTQGTTIELTTGVSEIAEACAGLRFLIATVALGTLFAYLSYRKWYKSLIFLFACVVVPILGNALRVLGIILLTHFTNNRIGAGADHIVYGWGLNVAILLVLMFVGTQFRDRDEQPVRASDPQTTAKASSAWAVISTACVIFAGMAAGPISVARASMDVGQADFAAIRRPLNLTDLTVSAPERDWHPMYGGADAEFAAQIGAISTVEPPVTLYLEYYGRSRPGHSLITHYNRAWDGSLWQAVTNRSVHALLAGTPIQLQETTIASIAETRLVWSSYWIGGHMTPSPFAAKLWEALDAVSGKRGEAALIVSTPIDSDAETARARLAAALARLKDVESRLEAASTAPPAHASR